MFWHYIPPIFLSFYTFPFETYYLNTTLLHTFLLCHLKMHQWLLHGTLKTLKKLRNFPAIHNSKYMYQRFPYRSHPSQLKKNLLHHWTYLSLLSHWLWVLQGKQIILWPSKMRLFKIFLDVAASCPFDSWRS